MVVGAGRIRLRLQLVPQLHPFTPTVLAILLPLPLPQMSAPARRREHSREGSWQSTPSTAAATGTNNVPLGRRSRYPSDVSHPAATSYVFNAFDQPSDRVDTTNINTWTSPDDRRAAPASEAQRSDHQSEIPSRCPSGEPTPHPKHSSTSTQRRDRTPESQARYARDARDSSVQAPRIGNDQRGYHDGSAADSPTARSEHRRRENSRPGGFHSSASRIDTSSHIRRPESITGTNMIPSRYRATSGVNDTAAPKPSSASRDKSRPDPDTSSHHASAAPLRASNSSPVKVQGKDASAPQDLVAIEASLQAVLTRRKVRLGSPSTRKLFGGALRSVAYQYNVTASPYTAYSRNLKGQQTQDAQDAQVFTTGLGAVGVEASATTMVSTPSAADDDWWNGPQGPPAVSADAISDSCGAADASSSKKRSREEQQNSQRDDAEKNKKSKIDGVSENEGVSELDVPSESTVAVDPWSNWASPESQDQKTPLSASPSSKDTAETSQATTVRVESESENVDPATNM
ncbi:BQ5605_C001g00173 [Microbotryum silenes-dioicae]|uniref:BQ5605_C001g00173 protein n=1 Tax=Microbotryum silenes-dioicae TaxID=796604 RepID=A0A2X0M2H0_9BASI|nr:BQ5605_C001g00173 [Microbotryum silenes-dioicae]